MKVSFLVTYYNQKEYVQQSIDSILNLEKPCEWEILVGDDGSTDGTIEKVQEYITKYPDNIKLYVMPREVNVNYDSVKRASANRLNILEKATGDLFCTLDGDDFYCDSTFLVDAVSVFAENPDVSVIAFGYKFFQEGNFGKDITLPIGRNLCVDKVIFLKKYYIHAGGCVYRKNFGQDRIDFIKEIGFFDDNNIVINSLNYGKIYSIPKAIYAYRQTGSSVFTSMDFLEQAALNVQGLDVDTLLMDKSYYNSIIERYSASVITLYIWRDKVNKVLTNEKVIRYLDGVEHLEESVFRAIVTGNTDEKLTNTVRALMIKNIKHTLKMYIKKMVNMNEKTDN